MIFINYELNKLRDNKIKYCEFLKIDKEIECPTLNRKI